MARTLTGTATSTPTHGTDGWAGRIYVIGVSLTSTTDASAITVYDNASAGSGPVVAKLAVAANNTSHSIMFDEPVSCDAGCYVVVDTGTAPRWVVYYK